MKTSTFAAALAVLLAFAPGRAAADPAVIFVSDYNGEGDTGIVPAYDAAGAAATGYATPSNFGGVEGVALGLAALRRRTVRI